MKNALQFTACLFLLCLVITGRTLGQVATIQTVPGFCAGNNTTVDVTLGSFSSPITGFQFTIRYDTGYLHYNNTSNWAAGVNGVIIQHNFYGTPPNVIDALTYVWADMPLSITGLLCQLDFTYKTPSSGCQNVVWSDNPTPRQFFDDNYNEIVVTYVDGAVCAADPVAQTITGTTPINVGSSETWTSTSAGGTWTSATPAVATVNSSTGVVTGISAGTSVITYSVTIGGCVNTATKLVTITEPPTATIQTISDICVGSNAIIDITLDNFSSTISAFQYTIRYDTAYLHYNNTLNWAAGVTAVSTLHNYYGTPPNVVDALTFVWGDTPVNINGLLCQLDFTYKETGSGCRTLTWSDDPTERFFFDESFNEFTVTYVDGQVCVVDPVPQTITGVTPINIGASATWTSTTAGGTWTSANPGVATVNSSTGLVTGISAGTSVITYSVTIGGCVNTATKLVTITSIPTATIETVSGICAGSNTDVDITLNNFSSPITGFQFTIRYDTAYLHYNNTSNWAPGVAGVGIQHNYYGTPPNVIDAITFVWGDIPVNLNGLLCQLNFKYKTPSSGCHTLIWSDSPTPTQFFDDNYNEVSVNLLDGGICSLTDAEPPTITCPVDVTVSTDAGLCTASGVVLGTPTTADNCSVASVTNNALEPYSLGNTNITWTVTDGSGNTATCTQIVTVTDNQPPVVQANGNSTVACPSNAIAPVVPPATDYCDGLVTGSLFSLVDNPNPVSCEGSRTYTYSYTDNASNVSYWTYTYTIERLPFADPADQGSTVACAALAVTPTLPTVTDNCGNTLTPTGPAMGGTYASCEGTITYTYTYTDCEGNINDWVYTYTIEREDFSMPANGSSTVACIADATAPAAPAVTNNCGNTITPTGPVSGGTYVSCEGTRTYTYTYTDCEGNAHDWVYTYTIERLPFADPADQGSTVACAALAVTPTLPTVTDNCGNTLTPTGPAMGGTYASCEGTITYTYTYTDCEGNTNDWVYTYTIEREDFSMPGNGSSTVACIADATAPSAPAVTDNCSNNITSTGPVSGGTYDGCEGTRTYTYTYTDCEGNTNDWVYTYTIERLPFADPADAGSTVACAALAVAPTLPTVTDNCGNTLTPTGPTMGGTYASCEGTVTYTYLYTDCEGNTNDWVYTYIIDIPTFADIAPTTATVDCYSNIILPTPPSVNDFCGTPITNITGPVEGTVPPGEGDVTYTWTYTDCAGNIKYYIHTVTIEFGSFAEPIPTTATVNCYSSIVIPTPPTVFDGCNNVLTPTGPVESSPLPTCEGDVTYTWTYIDGVGDPHYYVHTVTIEREDFIMPSNTSSTVSCAAEIVAPTPPSVNDNCGAPITPVAGTPPTEPSCEGDMVYSWTYTDCEGNSHIWSHTITIEYAPFAAITPTAETVTCYDDIVIPIPPTVYDNCNNLLIPTGPVEGPVPGCEGDVTYTWTYTDCEGNIQLYVHTVTIDIPTFGDIAPTFATVDCYSNIILPTPPTINDFCGKPITNITGPVEGTVPPGDGVVTYTWTYIDCAGNSKLYVHSITIDDNEIPTITCPANVNVTADAGLCTATGVALGTPVTGDNCSVFSVTNNAVEPYSLGNTTVTWTVTDGSGNTATCQQTVTVTDTQLPTITCPANVNVTADAGLCTATGVALGTPVTGDNCSVASVTNNAVEPFALGNTLVTWTVTDGSGNTATCQQTVTVTDTQLPTITCPANVNVTADAGLCTASGVALGTPVTGDNCSVASITNNAVEPFALGNTVVTWTVTDGSGNTATCQQTVTVTDTQLPTITCPATVNVTADAGLCTATGVVLGTPVTGDNCSVFSVTNNAVEPYSLGNTTVTWTVTDGSGNTATCQQTVTVADTEDPVIICSGPISVTAGEGECSSFVTVIVPTTTDNCGVSSVINDFNGTANASGTYPAGTTTVLWTVTDIHGNSSTCIQTVTVNGAVEITTEPAAQAPVCVGGVLSALSVTASGGLLPLTYQWYSSTIDDNETGAPISGATSSTYVPPSGSAGTLYYYCIVSVSGYDCGPDTSNTAAVTVVVDPTWASNTVSSNSICAGSQVSFSATVSNGQGGTITWIRSTTPGGPGIVVTSPYIESAPGTYYYRPHYEPTGEGCDLADGVESIINVAPTFPVSVTINVSPATIVCEGTLVTFEAVADNPGTAPVYQWTSNGEIVGSNSPTYIATLSSSGTIICTLTSDLECASGNPASDTIQIMVKPSLIAGISITTDNTVICSSSIADFTASPANGGTMPQYQWYLNSVLVGTGSTYSNNALITGDSIQCQLISNEACVINNPTWSNSIHMTVHQTPTAEAGAYATFTGTPIQVGDPSNGPGVFTWLPVTGLNDPGVAQPTASPTATTTYTLIVDNNGCTATDTVTITIGTLTHTISGKTQYAARVNAGAPIPNFPTYNPVIYSINNVIVVLKTVPGGIEVARDTSDALGNYQLNNIADGNYMLSYDKYTADTMQWVNDVNAIDIAMLKYYIGVDTLQDPSRCFSAKYKKAVDVDNNTIINAIDVARMKSKVGAPFDALKNFPKGNWVALNQAVTVTGSNLNINLETISYGDYNASSSQYRDSLTNWSGAKSLTKEFIITSDEYLMIPRQSYFEVPLKISTKVNDFAAMGLEINYPSTEYKLVSAYMTGTGKKGSVKINPSFEEVLTTDNDLLITDIDGVIRVVYATTNHFDVAPNDQIIVLGFRPLRELDRGELQFNLSGTGVIGNQFGQENDETYLLMPKIFVQDEGQVGFELVGYPNPFSDKATITYSIPEDGQVKLKVFNAIGELVSELENKFQEMGSYTVEFSSENLPAGMYTFKLEFTGADKSKCIIFKMIH